MQAFNTFKNMDASFWAFVKFVSENLGYTERGEGFVKKYPVNAIRALCKEHGVNASEKVIVGAAQYSKMRADLLNEFAEKCLWMHKRQVKNSEIGRHFTETGIIIASCL